jgi:hypothetical protein
MNGWRIIFDPFVSWPVLYVACGVAALLALFLIYLRHRGWPLRVASLALVLGALANPLLSTDERDPLPDVLAIVVDESASQAIGNRRTQTDQALADVQRSIEALGNTEVRIARTVTGTTPDTDGTRVFSALDRVAQDIPEDRYAGAIVITDGQIHDVPKTLSGLSAKGPVHALLTGSRSEFDRRIQIVTAPRFAITGTEQTVTFRVEDKPTSEGTASVTLRLPNGETQQLEVPLNADAMLQMPVQHAGQNLLQLETPVRDGELTALNNKALVNIKGIRDRLRVLLVSGEPHPGERTWRNLLKSDAAVDLVHFTILRPPEKQDGTLTRELSLIAFPTRELFLDKIKSFDLVIFDRYRMQSILPDAYLANVAQYVREGGAVLIASGPDLAAADGLSSTSLSEVMPALPTGDVTEQPFKPKLTQTGLRHPVSQNLPGSNGLEEPKWGRWFRVINVNTTPDANIVMDGPDGLPLLVLSRNGEGRIAQVLSDHGWLWARGFEGGGPQLELLRRLSHWLMKEPDLEEEALIARQDGGNIVIERRTLADAPTPVKLKSPNGKEQTIALQSLSPGVFTARVPMQDPGLYEATDGTLTTLAAIGNTDSKESGDMIATADKLQPTFAQSGGGAHWIEDGLPRLTKAKRGSLLTGGSWAAVIDNEQFRITAVREIPFFATLASLALLLLVITGMWYREGR